MNILDKLEAVSNQLTEFCDLSEDEAMQLPDNKLDYYERLNEWAGSRSTQALATAAMLLGDWRNETKARARALIGGEPADYLQMDTLKLLNVTARHLSGRNVTVKIQEPAHRKAIAETWAEGGAVNIAISPRAVADGNLYLDAFLHEVGHAKLHVMSNGEMMSNEEPEAAWKLESEATRQAAYWKHYANTYSYKGANAGGVNPSANYFRLKLLTLLNSQEAAERSILPS